MKRSVVEIIATKTLTIDKKYFLKKSQVNF